MHDDKDFPLGADDLDDEIEIEFVDVEDDGDRHRRGPCG